MNMHTGRSNLKTNWKPLVSVKFLKVIFWITFRLAVVVFGNAEIIGFSKVRETNNFGLIFGRPEELYFLVMGSVVNPYV
jgi:hypothetical protein